jgi:subtilisin family serine protease
MAIGRYHTAALLTAIVFAAAADARHAPGVVMQPDRPVVIDASQSAAARSAAEAALLRRAAAQGAVRVIVKMAAGPASSGADVNGTALRDAQDALARRAGIAAAAVTHFETIPFVAFWTTPAQLKRLLRDPAVSHVQEDVPGHAVLNKSAPFIHAPFLWRAGFKGDGYAIAVLDTGVDKTHPMLTGKVVAEACYSTNDAASHISSLCRGGQDHARGPGTGVNCSLSLTPCWHGTHIAAIAAGASALNGSTPMSGIAPGASVISIQVFSQQGNKVVTYAADWIRGLERVYALRTTYKIAAVNLSFGAGLYDGLCDSQNLAAAAMIRRLREAGIPTVVASGNDKLDGKTEAPACVTNAIAVGATLHTTNKLAPFSDNAPWVRLLAPGVGIVSAQAGGGFRVYSGTSAAAAHVSGAFAALRSVRDKSTIDDIAAALECSGPLVTRANLNKPRIDLSKAHAYLLFPPRTALSFTFDGSSSAAGWLSLLGNWQPFGGAYQPFENSAGNKVAVLPNCNEGENITAANMWRVGPDPDALQGVIFKAQFSGADATIMSGYLAAYDRSGNATILRLDSLDLAGSSWTPVILCSGTATLSGSNFNTVEVDTRGGDHTLLINGKEVCKATDRTYGTGFAGVLGQIKTSGPTNGLSVDAFGIVPVEKVPKKGS